MLIEIIEQQINSKLAQKWGFNNFSITKNRDINLGDFNSNFFLINLKESRLNAAEFQEAIKKELMDTGFFEQVKFAKQGFINLFLKNETHDRLIQKINAEKESFAQAKTAVNFNFNIEMVSANPTGFLHVGHARNGIIGQVLSNILKFRGYQVNQEYYINDVGNQIKLLGFSVFIRYLQQFQKPVSLTDNCYKGNEIIQCANDLKKQYNDQFIETIFEAENILEPEIKNLFQNFAIKWMLDAIQSDLQKLKIRIDQWSSEKEVLQTNVMAKTDQKLADNIYEKDGALWLRTTKYNDDKDRVLRKSDQTFTYFHSDICYHINKWENLNKPGKLINIWGSDHFNYITRIKIALSCFDIDPNNLVVICTQMVKIIKNNQEFKMSKRTGNSWTIREMLQEISYEAARWLLISQNEDSHIEIDVDKLNKKNDDNPIYYVQYAHARMRTLLRHAQEKQIEADYKTSLLTSTIEKELINHLHIYPKVLTGIAKTLQPSKLTNYIYELAKLFHAFYNKKLIIDEKKLQLSRQRVALTEAVRQIIANGLSLLDIQPAEKM